MRPKIIVVFAIVFVLQIAQIATVNYFIKNLQVVVNQITFAIEARHFVNITNELLKDIDKNISSFSLEDDVLTRVEQLNVYFLAVEERMQKTALDCLTLKVDNRIVVDLREGIDNFIVEKNDLQEIFEGKGVDVNNFSENTLFLKEAVLSLVDILSVINVEFGKEVTRVALAEKKIHNRPTQVIFALGVVSGGIIMFLAWFVINKILNPMIVLNKKLKESEEILVAKKEMAEKYCQEALKAAEAKANFLANMSHEIRTPMNSILGFTDLLRRTKVTDIQEKYIETIQSGGNLLLGIINDILDFSKLESGKVELELVDFNLSQVIKESFSMITAKMTDKYLDTYLNIDANVPTYVKGDPVRLKQIFVNLLGNSVKFTERGELGVLVSLGEEGINIDGLKKVSICFAVKDSGIGMSEHQQKKIFRAFTQADETTTRKFGGTGLGLSISKSLVEAMGGSIKVESFEGKGTEFIFAISFLKSGSVGNSPNFLKEKEKLKGIKVFIIDDNKIARKISIKICKDIGVKVIGIADSGLSALQMLDSLSVDQFPDVILCDIRMEDMGGFELAEKIRLSDKYFRIKMLAVTADTEAELSIADAHKTFDGFLSKPISFESMVHSLAELMENQTKVKNDQGVDNKESLQCKGLHILVVEDTIPNQMLIQAYCDQLGCTIDVANNGQEAIDKLRENNRYNLCLMDLQMPIIGGVEAAVIIRKEISKDLPIVALTAAVLPEDRKRTEESGMNGFLEKPIQLEKLKKAILQYSKGLG